LKYKSTKSLIVKTAGELILSYGYQGFSYNDIAKIIKIRKSSIHYHFPAKEDLGLAFIEKYNRLFTLWVKRLGRITNREKITAFCLLYSDLSQNGTRICPIGMVAAEYDIMPTAIQDKAQELILMVEMWLKSIIIDGIKNKEFKEHLDSSEAAREIIHVMSGAIKMARIFKQTERIQNAQEILESLIFIENQQGVNY
jgi:AcrR family transcriptional regulator